ncbi:MAG: aspartate kinase [Gammaproteobacteria bacterium]|nr:MAG: aspartate kinase [Gammaproteobacteria bacterium]
MSNIVIQKFGGTSLADTKRFKAVAKIIKETSETGKKVVAVVSAMAGETQRLIDLAKGVQEIPDPREYDALISSGEQVSVALLAMSLRSENLKSKSYTAFQLDLRTDDYHGKARISSIDTKNLLMDISSNITPVITGFQGINEEGDVTTLGRGGSDTSAVALAVALNAEECQIYTDVNGVYTTDPNVYENAKKIDKLTFEEMLELSSLGAKVLQIRSVEFASKYNMPIRVKSSFTNEEGTLINGDENMEDALISGVAHTNDEAKLTIRKVPDIPGIAAKIIEPISAQGIEVDIIIQNVSEDKTTDFTFTVKREKAFEAKKILTDLSEEFGGGEIELNEDISKVSLVGVGMKSHAGVAATMFKTLAENKINIEMISTSEIKISVIVKEDSAHKAVKSLHDAFNLEK